MKNVRGRASFSQISLAASCGEAYRRAYVVGESRPSGVPAEAGTAVHEAAKAYEDARLEGSTLDLLAEAKGFLRQIEGLESMRFFGKQDVAWWLREGLKVRCDNYLAQRATEDAWTYLHGEWEFEATFGGHTLTGAVDQILRDSQGRTVVRDLKCGREKPWHAMQVQFYMLAVLQKGLATQPVYGQVLYLNGSKPKVQVVPLTLTQEDADRMVSDLGLLLEHEIFPATGPFTDGCTFCDFKSDCPWGQVGLSNTQRSGAMIREGEM